MKHTLAKLGATVSTVALLTSSFAGVVGASVTGTGMNNTTGADSKNEVEIEVEQSTYVDQSNDGVVINKIDLNANTGDNEANKNTGEGHITTGDVDTGVGISNILNTNAADVDACGGCDMDLYVANEKTGADSENEAEIEVKKESILEQRNSAYILNEVDQDLNTGGNEANKNTGMGYISTGDADSVTIVENSANENVASVGSHGGGSMVLTAGNDTTGADSENEAEVEVELFNWVNQSNFGSVLNDVEIDADTGDNEANKNTGLGDVFTGDIDTGVGLSSSLNSNFLAFDGCCDVELGMLNHKTGAESENEAEAEVETENVMFQSNCERERDHHDGLFGFGKDFGHHLRCGVVNLVEGDLDTGDNETNKNTADGVDTGDIDAAVEVLTDENENVIGSAALDLPDVEWGEVPSSAWWMLFFGMSV